MMLDGETKAGRHTRFLMPDLVVREARAERPLLHNRVSILPSTSFRFPAYRICTTVAEYGDSFKESFLLTLTLCKCGECRLKPVALAEPA